MNKIKAFIVCTLFVTPCFYSCDNNIPTSNNGAKTIVTSVVNGQELFEEKCSGCHGSDGTAGIANAANLKVSKLDSNMVFKTISEGKNGMPSFKSSLTEIEIHKLVKYVYALRE